MNDLIKKSWKDYQILKGMHCVMDNVIPILWFGDLKAYKKSQKKIVTVSLNPSNNEFQDRPCDPYSVGLRFKEAVRLIPVAQLSDPLCEIYSKAMNDYFKYNPYKKWFIAYEKPLNILGSTYGGKMTPGNAKYKNVAIHIDVAAPIPTSPTWGKICKDCKEIIQAQCNSMDTLPVGYATRGNGYSLFEDLLSKLDPDIVVAALGRSDIEKVFCALGSQLISAQIIKKLALEDGNNSYIRLYRLSSGKTLIWCSNMQGTPLRGTKKELIEKTFIGITKCI